MTNNDVSRALWPGGARSEGPTGTGTNLSYGGECVHFRLETRWRLMRRVPGEHGILLEPSREVFVSRDPSRPINALWIRRTTVAFSPWGIKINLWPGGGRPSGRVFKIQYSKWESTMLSKKMQKALNDQVNAELYSSTFTSPWRRTQEHRSERFRPVDGRPGTGKLTHAMNSTGS